MHSAVKVKGQKLYELARRGQTIEREPRSVRVDGIDLLSWRNPLLEIEARCGHGVYIRSLAHDLGQALGVGGHLLSLRRTRSGAFSIADCISLERVMADDDWLEHIVSPWGRAARPADAHRRRDGNHATSARGAPSRDAASGTMRRFSRSATSRATGGHLAFKRRAMETA